mmetsp:Transcript_14819/g.31535  ORF Transcript_14819/g.31535 Transcript_14819/m.31535 type:complete len:239 (-) Transcript_14819:68-784(-)
MILNLLLSQTSEFPLFPLYTSYFNLIPSEIAPQHTPQAHNCSPHCFVKAIFWYVLHSLFQKVSCLLLLRPARRALERQEMPCRIDLQNLRTLLIVHAHDEQHHRQRTHARTLSIHLSNVRHTLRQHGGRDRIPVFEFKVGGLISHPLHGRMAVGCHARGEDTDFGRHVVHMANAGGNNEAVGDLALGDNDGGISATEGDASQARGGGSSLEGVLHLIETALGGEDGDVVVIVTVAGHG